MTGSEQSRSLADALGRSLTEAERSWMSSIDELRRRRASPAAYRQAWDAAFGRPDAARLSTTPLWIPDQEALTASNVARWMADLGLDEFAAFHRWTVEHREEYWRQVLRRLAVAHEGSTARVLDRSGGDERAAWFPDLRINIARSCFLADREQTALVAQRPGESLRRIDYGELEQWVLRVAASVRRAGFSPGDRLAVVLPMTPESVAVYLGVIEAGCCVVSIADSFAVPEIAARLRIADAQGVFTYDVIERAGRSIELYRRVAESTSRPIVVLPWRRERGVAGALAPSTAVGRSGWLGKKRSPPRRVRWSARSTCSFRPGRPANRKRSSGTTARRSKRPPTLTFTRMCDPGKWSPGRRTWVG